MKFEWFIIVLSGFLVISCGDSSESQERMNRASIQPNVIVPSVPDKMKFCGENILFDNFEVRERLDKELIVNTYYHSSTVQAMKRASRYFPFIEKILKQENIPSDFKYLCLIESNLLQATSPSGAKGFWQFMPQTASEYGLTINSYIDERLHIEKSTKAACEYLRTAYEEFGDWTLTAAAYNKGTGGIKRDLELQKVESYFDLFLNRETSRYVFRILAMKLIFENPVDYGFDIKKEDTYSPISYNEVRCSETIKNLSDWSRENGSNLKMIKALNPWILDNTLPIENDTLTVLIPVSE